MNNIINMMKDNYNFSYVEILDKLFTKGDREAYVINADCNKYVLKLFGESYSQQVIMNDIDAIQYLEDNEEQFAPKLYPNKKGELSFSINNKHLYLMEYIEGRELVSNNEDCYDLGNKLSKLHKIEGYKTVSGVRTAERIDNMLKRFHEYTFKEDYDSVVNSLPKFEELETCLIHTDITLRNAIRKENGDLILIDWDDSGSGSLFVDVGYPLITQFVNYNNLDNMSFNDQLARAFYTGYFKESKMEKEMIKHIFDGAVFMQLMYMPCYGDEGIKPMWRILNYGLDNKEEILNVLYEAYEDCNA